MAPPAGDGMLIGREQERAALAHAATEARAGRGSLVLVCGEAGIGKTSLIRQALAEDDVLVLEGRAHQGVALPYGPLVAALRARPAEGPDAPLADDRSARRPSRSRRGGPRTRSSSLATSPSYERRLAGARL